MKKLQFLLVLLVVLQTSFVVAQKVSNIAYRQEQSNIIVSYDLETKTPCKVNLYVSTNGGATWQGPLTKVTGDVGTKIATGSHSITWNVLEEFEELRGDKIQFQVRALGNLELTIKTLKIGTQAWTKKNLDVSTYRNGDIIPEVKDKNEWYTLTTGAWCYYNNDPKNGLVYGKLYNWYAVNDPRGLAPEGFHIPTKDEFDIDELKNNNRFSVLEAGERTYSGYFIRIDDTAIWWSSSKFYDTDKAWYRSSDYFGLGNLQKNYGFSVRCIKD